jgi:hypothetical protein
VDQAVEDAGGERVVVEAERSAAAAATGDGRDLRWSRNG